MMSVRRQITQLDGVYFVTFTCADWLPLFDNNSDVVYAWFNYLKTNGHCIIGYVIMTNHLHTIIAFRNTGKPINTIVSDGKQFMAYEIVKRLEKNKQVKILAQLQNMLLVTERKQGKLHKVFETSFDWKECRTDSFIIQKLNYIHGNPCKAGLCKVPEEYKQSSAKFYITGDQDEYNVTSYTELQDVDLTVSR